VIGREFRRQVEAIVRAMLAGWAWQAWTPTITQGVPVTATVAKAIYQVVGKRCSVRVRLNITSAGTGGTQITIAGFPAGCTPDGVVNNIPVGGFFLQDTGASPPFRIGNVVWNASAGGLLLFADGQSAAVGVSPSLALAAGDVVAFDGRWDIA
jgi:hypothetical protein